MTKLRDTLERVNPDYFKGKEKYLLYLRHVFAYEYVCDELDTSASVLEVGAGEGYGTHMLAQQVREILAVDIEAPVVAYAQEKYGSDTCRFESFDGTTFPVPDASVDAVVSFQVIEHVPDDDLFVAEAHRVLKPGGKLILTTPNRTHRIEPGAKIWNKYHIREYYPEELEAVLAKHFAQAEVKGIRGDDEVNEIEHKRVKRGLSMRKLIPEPIKKWVDGDVAAQYGTANFYVIEGNVADSLDLLGVCTK